MPPSNAVLAVLNFFEKFEQRNLKYIGLTYAFLNACTFTLGSLIIKLLTQYSPSEIALYRGIVGSVFSYFVLRGTGGTIVIQGAKNNFYTIVFRSGILIILTLAQYYSTKALPLGEAKVLSSVEPVISGITAAFLLNEKYDFSQFAAFVLSFFGILLIIKPHFLFPDWVAQGNKYTDPENRTLGQILVLVMVFMSVALRIATRKHLSKLNSMVVAFYSLFVQCFIMPLFIIFSGREMVSFTVRPDLLICFGISALVTQALGVRALKFETVGRCTLMGHAGIVMSYLLDIFVLGIDIDAYSFGGALLIIVSVFLMVLWKSK